MDTPKAVLDAEAEADRMIAQLAGESDTSKEETDTEDEKPQPDETVETAAEEKSTKDVEVKGDDKDAVIADLQEKLRTLTAAHDTLRGKTYAEVPRVLAENKVLREELAEIKSLLAANKATEKTDAKTETKPTGKTADLLASIKEDVSEEVADKISAFVRAVTEEQIASRITPVEGRVESLSKTSVKDAEDRYLATLANLVPDWKEIAAKEDYADFLQGVDPVSGSKRYDLAYSALEKLDAKHMSVFFDLYKKEKGISKSAAPAEEAARPTGKEALMAPKGSLKKSERADVGSGEADLITTKELEAFNRKRKTMSAETEAKWEARIDRAIQNGWIVP